MQLAGANSVLSRKSSDKEEVEATNASGKCDPHGKAQCYRQPLPPLLGLHDPQEAPPKKGSPGTEKEINLLGRGLTQGTVGKVVCLAANLAGGVYSASSILPPFPSPYSSFGYDSLLFT